MLLQNAIAVVLTVVSTRVIAAPVDPGTLGSKHNLYLVTCTKKPDCPIILICPRQRAPSYTAVAYYANGPIESSRNTNPTQISTVSDPAAPWEGTQRVAKLGRTGDFASNIDAGANKLAKGQIAGAAKLAAEDFVCFRDGETTFTVRNDLLPLQQYTCTADYWCPSIQV